MNGPGEGLGLGGLGASDMRQLVRNPQALRDPSTIASMLTQTHPETGESPAELFADVINMARADTRRLGQEHGVDLDADLMSPERAAHLMAGVVAGDGINLLLAFNDLAEKRDQVLDAALDGGDYREFMTQKHAVMHTEPGEFDEGDE